MDGWSTAGNQVGGCSSSYVFDDGRRTWSWRRGQPAAVAEEAWARQNGNYRHAWFREIGEGGETQAREEEQWRM
jgi:hypothetical protein